MNILKHRHHWICKILSAVLSISTPAFPAILYFTKLPCITNRKSISNIRHCTTVCTQAIKNAPGRSVPGQQSYKTWSFFIPLTRSVAMLCHKIILMYYCRTILPSAQNNTWRDGIKTNSLILAVYEIHFECSALGVFCVAFFQNQFVTWETTIDS